MSDEKKTVDPTTEANDNLTEEQLGSTAGGRGLGWGTFEPKIFPDAVEKDKDKPGAKTGFI